MRASKSLLSPVWAVLTALVVVAGLGVATPAQADATDIRLVSPSTGESLPAGVEGVQFVFDTRSAGVNRGYDFNLSCNSRWGQQQVLSFSAPIWANGASVTVTVGQAMPAAGSQCWADLAPHDPEEFAAYLGPWQVDEQQRLTNVRASSASFYPRVRDGWLDDVEVSWVVENWDFERKVDLRVVNSAGTSVRSASADYGWSWDGRDYKGALVPAGKYRIVASLPEPTPGAPAQEVAVPVEVRTDVVPLRKTITKAGHQSAVSAARSCRAVRDPDWDESTMLDCWGGKQAVARYRFTIPANAYSVSWALRTVTTGADVCCSGKVTKSGVRSKTKTAFTITGKVTGWRAMDIRRASVTYTAMTRR